MPCKENDFWNIPMSVRNLLGTLPSSMHWRTFSGFSFATARIMVVMLDFFIFLMKVGAKPKCARLFSISGAKLRREVAIYWHKHKKIIFYYFIALLSEKSFLCLRQTRIFVNSPHWSRAMGESVRMRSTSVNQIKKHTIGYNALMHNKIGAVS